jgi:hypothetical protein
MLDEDCGVEVGLWAYPPVTCIGDRWGMLARLMGGRNFYLVHLLLLVRHYMLIR